MTENINAGRALSSDDAKQPAKLLGWWRFAEGTGTTVADSSGNGHGLTAHGSISWTGGLRFGGGVQLDGATQWLSTAQSVLRTDESFSVAAWLRVDSAALVDGKIPMPGEGRATTAVSQDGECYSQFFLGVRLISSPGPDGSETWLPRWCFTVAPPPPLGGPFEWKHAYAATPIDESMHDRWVFLVGVYDVPAGVARIYVPSTGDQGSVKLPDGWPRWRADGPLQIGQGRYRDEVADQWSGSIGAVRVYSGVLTEQEAAKLCADES